MPFRSTRSNATLEFWLNPSVTDREQDIFWTTTAPGDTNRFNIGVNGPFPVGGPQGGFFVVYRDPNGTVQLPIVTAGGIIPAGEWSFIAIVKQGDTYDLYVNNRLTNNVTVLEGSGTSTLPLPTSTGWTINGRAFVEPLGTVQFAGGLDEIRLSDQALSPSQFLVAAGPISVPEPTTCVLLSTGLAGLVLLRRRQRRARSGASVT